MKAHATSVLYIGQSATAVTVRHALDAATRAGAQKFSVTLAKMGSLEGLERLNAGGVDVVLVDAAASAEGALDALVRARIEAPNVPVVVLTGGDDGEKAAAQALETGAQDWLPIEPLDGALLVRVLRYAMERERLQATLRQLALTDELTGLYNRRGFLTLADHHLRLAPRTRGVLLASSEVAGLEELNQTFGRLEGDRAIVAAAAILRETFRASDIVARLGHNDFAVLVLDAGEEAEDLIAPRLRNRVKRHNSDHPESKAPLQLAVGIARFDNGSPPIASELLEKASRLRDAPAR